MFQPVAQTLTKAPAPEDLGLFESKGSKYGADLVVAPFMRQAALYIAAFGANVRFWLICR
jgi:hypothetical protein